MALMQVKTAANGDIAGGVEHWIDKYSSKVPDFLHANKKTLGNVTAEWRFGEEEYFVKFKIITEDLTFYETFVGYHKDGTQFRLNDTPDLGHLLLKSKARACKFYRIAKVTFTIAYQIDLTCKLIEEGL